MYQLPRKRETLMKTSAVRGAAMTAAIVVSFCSIARADLVGTSLVDLGGTGFGNVTSLLGEHGSNQDPTETGGISWNGSAFVGSSDTIQCCSGPASQIVSIGSLGWTSGTSVGLVVNFNTAGAHSGPISLTDLTLSLYNPITHTAVTSFSLDHPYDFTEAQVAQGTGQAGWLFTLNAAEQAIFSGFATNQNLLAVTTSATFTNPTGGPENIFALNAAAVPGPIVGAGLPGLIAGCLGLLALARRRRARVA